MKSLQEITEIPPDNKTWLCYKSYECVYINYILLNFLKMINRIYLMI